MLYYLCILKAVCIICEVEALFFGCLCAKQMQEVSEWEQEYLCMETLAECMSNTSSDMSNFKAAKQEKTAVLRDTVLQMKALIGQGSSLFHWCSFM